MRLKSCNLHFTAVYWRGIQPNHKAVPAIQKIVRRYVTIISTHSSLIKGTLHVEGPEGQAQEGNEGFKYLLESYGNRKYLRSLDVTVKIIASKGGGYY